MNHFKRSAAFIMGLLLCFGNAAAPAASVYATDDEVSTVMAEEDNELTDGNFRYTLDDDGNATLTGCDFIATEVTVPDTLGGHPVTEIASSAFRENKANIINIPAGIVYISSGDPFSSCLSLKEINVSEDNTEYCSVDGVLYSADMKKLLHYPAYKDGDSFAVPDGVEEIGIAALSENKLKTVTLPDSVKTIGRHAFSFDEELTAIDMSNTSVELIDVMTFINCSSLTSVKFSESTTDIELAAFYGCTSLAEVTLPENLISVGQSAFMGTPMKEIRVPDSVVSIGYSAFGYDMNENPNDSFVIIGSTGSAAYKYCSDSDSEYDYANNFIFKSTDVADAEAEYNALDTVAAGEYEYAIIDGEACITICVSIDSEIIVPEEIDGYKVTSIYKGAFLNNEAKKIVLPETVKTIGEAAFSSLLESLTIPGGCEGIEGSEPFLDCVSLKEFIVTEGDGAYSSKDGVLYDRDMTSVLAYPVDKEDKTYTAPDSVKEIAMSAFCGNLRLEEITLTNVEAIGNYAFENCAELSKVKFSKELRDVGVDAFLDCPKLKSVRLYDKLEYIGDYAFGFAYDAVLAGKIEQGVVEDAEPFSVVSDFKIYTTEDSLAYKYAQACGITVVTGTVEFAGTNVNKAFLCVIIGIVAAAVLTVVGVITGKSLSKKKASKSKTAPKKTDEEPEEAEDESEEEVEDEIEEADEEATEDEADE